MQTEEYFIKVAFITKACLWCPFPCHFSISHSSHLSLSLFSFPLTLCLLSASHLSVSLCHFFYFLSSHLSLPRASVLWSFLPLFLFISAVRLCCEGLQWPFVGREGFGTGSRDHHDVDSLSPNSPLQAKQQLQNSPYGQSSHGRSPLTC